MNKPAPDAAAMAKAFEALATYDSGSGRAALMPIDDAVVASLGDAAARKELVQRLVVVLQTRTSIVAKEYVCSKLRLIGSADSVPALAALLGDKDLAHAARDALESMPCPGAVQAIREALPKLAGLQKVGAMQSLGTRRDVPSVPALAGLLADQDPQTAVAAAAALGEIGTLEAAEALRKAASAGRPFQAVSALADALLACAERLAADGKKAESQAICATLDVPGQPKHVRWAAARCVRGRQ
jgi:HEAT repeat protein